jgi:hypothetical protein
VNDGHFTSWADEEDSHDDQLQQQSNASHARRRRPRRKKKANPPLGRPPDLQAKADGGKLQCPPLATNNGDHNVVEMLDLAQETPQIPDGSAAIASHWLNARQCGGADQPLCDTIAMAAERVCSMHRHGQIGEEDLQAVLGLTIKAILDLPTPAILAGQ